MEQSELKLKPLEWIPHSKNHRYLSADAFDVYEFFSAYHLQTGMYVVEMESGTENREELGRFHALPDAKQAAEDRRLQLIKNELGMA